MRTTRNSGQRSCSIRSSIADNHADVVAELAVLIGRSYRLNDPVAECLNDIKGVIAK